MRGIMFTAPMVRLIGQTPIGYRDFPPAGPYKTQTRRKIGKRPYKVGERLYIKEAWIEAENIHYLADVEIDSRQKHSARFMPERLARYFVEIIARRQEFLLDITWQDAKAEGFESVAAYLDYFYKIHGEGNPPVFVYDFVRIV